MSIDVKCDGSAARVSLNGELNIYTVAEIKASLADCMEHADRIEIDLFGVSDIDTAGLQLMLIAKRDPGKEVHFVNHPPCVLRLVDLANLAGVLGDPLVMPAREPEEGQPCPN
ncbi:lipid asymmetry maintenance protein MlaB [Azoarcus sp. KH32C]|uniref:STAS domain-containing protein n=1 Tax=Azoarcus sp. KH32C TaxID=748247 RepID=UPI00023867ED|nr:STAS domain-containing protein [Azoarcus sp. KH32C]BAL23183.1 anti-sigma factor antagonist containing STAS domain [Azoarcus sp. KH32C]